jgi:hypothetical protein
MQAAYGECGRLCKAIAAVTPAGILGAGVRARAAIYTAPHWWDEPVAELDWPEHNIFTAYSQITPSYSTPITQDPPTCGRTVSLTNERVGHADGRSPKNWKMARIREAVSDANEQCKNANTYLRRNTFGSLAKFTATRRALSLMRRLAAPCRFDTGCSRPSPVEHLS